MKPSAIAVLAALTLLIRPVEPSAQPLDLASLDAELARVVREKHIPGLSVGVMHEGRVILAKAYGVSSLETGEPLTPETLLAVGSVTKEFTCTAALLLAEEGKLAMDEKVAKYFPELTRASDITLLDLGQHVSGYRDYYPLDFVHRDMARPRPSDDVIQEYASRPLDFEPGSRYSYSNTGYLMLGRVVERVSGESFGSFLSRRILDPLGMRSTRYEPERSEPGLAQGYTSFALASPKPAIAEGDGWIGAAGGIWSTPKDLLAWDLALMDGKIVSKESYAVMTTPRRLSDGSSSDYGCGLRIRSMGGATVLSHGGALSGFVASNAFVPSTRSAVVVLASVDFAALGDLPDAILAKLLPRPGGLPGIAGPPALEVASALLEQLRRGSVDREALGEEYGIYITPERLRAAAASLQELGEVSGLELVGLRERGEMEVASFRLSIGATPAQAILYRSRDGKVQEFLINRR
ncbi:MAG TPA: serine hydrolase domain-containing protein [Vicinamibacteria bacterium]|nr:serine hydrolase domain-containing protein [Vicinamibacteria bacterium]